jgi:BirA family transcriptional regulator, biotin operon repressor / biotin---[acetyl-CoA-carboxylase] ligase
MANQELSVSLVKKTLSTRFIGQKIVYYPILASTMETAREKARQGTADGTVVIAGEQTAGKGRLQRNWVSPGGNIALSIILYPEAANLPYLIMIASLAAASAIESVTGIRTQIKWPNDILIRGKKTAGILIENALKGDRVAYAIVGIGINAALQPGEFKDIAATATSLEAETGIRVSREAVISGLLTEFERLYSELPEADIIFKVWRGRLITLGQPVTATWGEKKINGIAECVDESGALMIRLSDGALTKVVAGDVTLREK